MEHVSILTQHQKSFLDTIRSNEYILSRFYFTGGTALAEHYLQHRYSDDIDLFSLNPLENQVLLSFMTNASRDKFTFTSRFVDVVYMFYLVYVDKIELKIDFAHYPYKKIEKETVIDKIKIDSLTDIAVNKLLTISQRTDIKDFIDLYFLLKQFSLWDLMEGVKIKFGIKLEPFLMAGDFMKIDDFTFLPRMIKPVTLSTLRDFFHTLAKKLGQTQVE